MEQRRLRLGDILDDYCPRERRVTNHAIVAMVEEDVKQTRCTTCDTEHVYKGGKVPRRKKSETTGKLYKQVLAGLTDKEPIPSTTDTDPSDESEHVQDPEAIPVITNINDTIEAAHAVEEAAQEADPAPGPEEDPDDSAQPVDDGPVHRPLIRAQLPRVEGLKVERQAPDFTIRHAGGRGNGHFRGGGNNGQRFGRGPHRSGGGGGGGGRGGGQGFGRGNQQRQGGGGGGGPRKRGR